MSFKKFITKCIDDFKEYNRPENVKARTASEIDIMKLKIEKEKLRAERQKLIEKRFQIGVK